MTEETTPTEDTNPQTPEDQIRALAETIGSMTLTELADLLGRAVTRLDELALDNEIKDVNG